MSTPRVCIAIAEFYPWLGGAEQQARMQGRLLYERGVAATVVTLRLERSWRKHDTVDGAHVIRVAGWLVAGREKRPPLLRKLSYIMGMAAIGWTLWRQRHNYDVVHVYKLNIVALSAALGCAVARKPMLVVVRSAGLGGASARESDLSWVSESDDTTTATENVVEAQRLYGDLEDLERIGRPGVQLCRYLLRRNGAVVVALSSRMRTYLAEHHFDLPGNQLIPNGVDTRQFAPAVLAPHGDERKHTVMCVSKLRYEKGVDVLLRAWRQVQDEAPDSRLIIVGDGPLRSPLERLAADLGIEHSVEFAGRQADVPAQLSRTGLAVLSSRYEGMPNAVLEAMSCGVPCVATRVSGTEDIIQDGVNGLLVNPEEVEPLAQALLILLRDPELAQQLGRAARVTIERHYAVDHIMEQYEDLYQHLASRDRSLARRLNAPVDRANPRQARG